MVNGYGARLVGNIRDNVICRNKQRVKDVVACLLLSYYFLVGPKIAWCQNVVIAMSSDPAPLFPTYSYIFMKVSQLKKNGLIKARIICKIFRFMDDSNSFSDGAEFKNNHCDIYPKVIELGEENTDKHESSFLDLDIKIRHGKFQVCLFDKRDSFPFSILRMTENSSNVSSAQFILQLELNDQGLPEQETTLTYSPQ